MTKSNEQGILPILAASSPGRAGDISPWGERALERFGNLPKGLLVSVPYVKSDGIDSPHLVGDIDPSRAAGAAILSKLDDDAARGHSSGSCGRDGSGSGGGHTWRPILSGNGERVGERGAGDRDEVRWQVRGGGRIRSIRYIRRAGATK